MSLVGACTTKALSLKDTTPTRTPGGCLSTKARAAALAASRRVGSRSVARMDPETSMVRITVPSWAGRVTTETGRAMARIMTAKPAMNRAGGTWRRQPGPRPRASFTRDRLA